MKNSLLIIIVSQLVWTAAARADASINLITDEQPVTIYIKDQRVKIVSAETQTQAQGEAIFDELNNRLTIVDHANQSLFDVDAQTIEKIGGTLDAAVGAVQNQMRNMSSGQKQKMQDLIRGFGLSIPEESPPELVLSKGIARKYQNIECVEHQVLEGEQSIATVCITQRNTLGINDQDYFTLLAAQRFMLNAASKATQLAEQYGQKIPDFGGIELNGVLVHSLQNEPYDANAEQAVKASFSISTISNDKLTPIVAPSTYQKKSLPF